MNFKEFYEYVDTPPLGNIKSPATAGAGILPSDYIGQFHQSNDPAPIHPHNSSGILGIPSTTVSGRINDIQDKKHHSSIVMFISGDDGKTWTLKFTPEEYRRVIKGGPEVGKKVTIVFQRRPEDKGQWYSQIQNITVH